MQRVILPALAVFVLFSNFSCPGPCEEEFFGSNSIGDLVVNLSDNGGAYAVGDEFSVFAEFSATMTTPGGNSIIISEEGGLVVVEVFRIMPDTTELALATADFTVTVPEGELLDSPAEDPGRAFFLRYRCPSGTCAFRQALQTEVPGEYILRVSGSAIDEIGADFRYCGTPTLNATTLVGGNNFPAVYADTFFEYPETFDAFWGRGTFINTRFEQPVYYFTVE